MHTFKTMLKNKIHSRGNWTLLREKYKQSNKEFIPSEHKTNV